MSQQITWNNKAIREFLVYPADIQQISILKRNLTTKLGKFYFLNFYNSKCKSQRFQKSIFHRNPSMETKDMFRFVPENVWNGQKSIQRKNNYDFIRFHTFLTQNERYLWFPWMDVDEIYLFGIVMSYTSSYKNLESKIYPISLLNLTPKLKFAEYRQSS